ncbi:MAG: hypothetical protein M1830_005482, partial [Pleopsidium flavum]
RFSSSASRLPEDVARAAATATNAFVSTAESRLGDGRRERVFFSISVRWSSAATVVVRRLPVGGKATEAFASLAGRWRGEGGSGKRMKAQSEITTIFGPTLIYGYDSPSPEWDEGHWD